MKRKILLTVGGFLIGLAMVVTAFGIFFVGTPEYALWRMASDVKEDGLNGLRPYLTENAEKTLDSITAISQNKVVKILAGLLMLYGKLSDTDYAGILKSEIKSVKWSLKDVEKDKTQASVTLGFDYEQKLVGTVSLTMAKIQGDWKIDSISIPRFQKIDL